jgi:hypothetical protein
MRRETAAKALDDAAADVDGFNAYRAANGLPQCLQEPRDAAARTPGSRAASSDTTRMATARGPRGMPAIACQRGREHRLTSSNDPAVVQSGWESSPGHVANMRGPSWGYVGIGYYEAPAATAQVTVIPLTPEQLADLLATLGELQPPADGGTPKVNYWVQVFGDP